MNPTEYSILRGGFSIDHYPSMESLQFSVVAKPLLLAGILGLAEESLQFLIPLLQLLLLLAQPLELTLQLSHLNESVLNRCMTADIG